MNDSKPTRFTTPSQIEPNRIIEVLTSNDWNISASARALSLKRPSLDAWIITHKILRPKKMYSKNNALQHVAREVAGSVDKFIEFISYRFPPDDLAVRLIQEWQARDKRSHHSLDALVSKLDIDPARVFAWACEGAYRYLVGASKIRAASALMKVMARNIKEATTGEDGFKDRSLFYKSAGLLPKGEGVNVNVQTNVNETNADVAFDMPSFDTERREIAAEMRVIDVQPEALACIPEK